MSGECPVCSEHTLECKCHIVDYIHWAMTRCKPDSRPCESFEAMAYLMLKWIAYLDAEKKEIQRLRSE